VRRLSAPAASPRPAWGRRHAVGRSMRGAGARTSRARACSLSAARNWSFSSSAARHASLRWLAAWRRRARLGWAAAARVRQSAPHHTCPWMVRPPRRGKSLGRHARTNRATNTRPDPPRRNPAAPLLAPRLSTLNAATTSDSYSAPQTHAHTHPTHLVPGLLQLRQLPRHRLERPRRVPRHLLLVARSLEAQVEGSGGRRWAHEAAIWLARQAGGVLFFPASCGAAEIRPGVTGTAGRLKVDACGQLQRPSPGPCT
jgi:hypothetical protein